MKNYISKLDRITEKVCKHFNIADSTLRTKCRRTIYSNTRHVIWAIASDLFGKRITLQQLGDYFGYSHSNVIHGIKQVKALQEFGKEYAKDYAKLLASCERRRPDVTKTELIDLVTKLAARPSKKRLFVLVRKIKAAKAIY